MRFRYYSSSSHIVCVSELHHYISQPCFIQQVEAQQIGTDICWIFKRIDCATRQDVTGISANGYNSSFRFIENRIIVKYHASCSRVQAEDWL